MVLLGRIELPTSSLPMTRSTTELQQLYYKTSAKATIKQVKCHAILNNLFSLLYISKGEVLATLDDLSHG